MKLRDLEEAINAAKTAFGLDGDSVVHIILNEEREDDFDEAAAGDVLHVLGWAPGYNEFGLVVDYL